MYFDVQEGVYRPDPNQGPASFIQELISTYERDGRILVGVHDDINMCVREGVTFETLLSEYISACKRREIIEESSTRNTVIGYPEPKVVKKVKILSDYPGAFNDDLEDRVNRFIEDKNVESIQYSISDKKHGAMIIYTEVDR